MDHNATLKQLNDQTREAPLVKVAIPDRDEASDVESDDEVQLSAFTLSALQEFVSEQVERERKREEAAAQSASADPDQDFQENWQLSQFWYDQSTCRVLANEAIRVAGPTGHVACLSSPTLYRHLLKVRPPGLKLTLLEYDQRFEAFADDFVLYDYRAPLAVPGQLRHSCDLVVADPPFLSEECLTKTALTVRLIAKHQLILCTGAQMGELATRLLAVHECRFRPLHTNNLANEFRCFANYSMDEHVNSDDGQITDAGENSQAPTSERQHQGKPSTKSEKHA